MKILVIGLDGATPELLFGDESLANVRRLMAYGCYGRLESVIPPATVPAWMCMATGQDPGSLGVYGARDRLDRSYSHPASVDSRSITELCVWDQIARGGGGSVVIGVPPNYPAREVKGISVGCFLTPDTSRGDYTHPAGVAGQIAGIVGAYPADVEDVRPHDKDGLREAIYAMSRRHFEVVRHFLRDDDWSYFQFVEIGLDRIQHGFWKDHAPEHVLHEPDSPYKDVVRDYYRYLDDEIGSLLELLTEETAVLVVSEHGARKLDGGFCVDEWLVREGLLVLNRYPEDVTPSDRLDIDWRKTRAWSEGGHYARVFLNVKGREPEGSIEPADYGRVRDEIKARLEATAGPDGPPLGTLVFKPEEIYRSLRNVAPDLIVHLGGLAWRSIGGVGYPTLHLRQDDIGPDECNHAQHGAFILASQNGPASGQIEGVHLLDIAPTLLELGGYDCPPSMQGKSFATARDQCLREAGDDSTQDEMMVRDRLSGLGYL